MTEQQRYLFLFYLFIYFFYILALRSIYFKQPIVYSVQSQCVVLPLFTTIATSKHPRLRKNILSNILYRHTALVAPVTARDSKHPGVTANFAVRWRHPFHCLFSSADPKVSSAELMVLLICPSSVVVRRPSTFALNRYSSYSSYSIILIFLLEKLGI